ncbi:hypothetical protein [Streptomyces sp. CBMA29]|uniref:LppU/SCO3897 family protein n=1 Tax=Streptomyces sp. CBMA29 TaxID=1896314 RepID=UPI001CB738FE|nr:hypothetical protein [Streptomyces sp. CBMA29]MBD0737523.1 hypothetical protein [Streptomyces sp. CBMA29]
MATPPPPGRNPYGQPYAQQTAPPPPAPPQQGQNPYGQNPYGQNPYGQNPYGQGQPSQNPYGPPQGQGQQPFGYPQTGPQTAPDGSPACTFCGGFPAVQATVRGHQGFLIIMRFLKRRANYCRTCGIATHREMTTKTLWQGWWGLGSFVITPITVLINLGPRGRFNKLPAPSGGFGPPMNPGKPIFLRGGAYVMLAPLLVLAIIIAGVAVGGSGANSASAGDCVSKNGSDSKPNLKVVDCTSDSAAYRVVERHGGNHYGDACSESYAEYDHSGPGGDYALCLTRVN